MIAAIINLVVSIVLAYPLGISGILLGTIISRLCVYFWYDPYIIHKTMFVRGLKYYFITYLIYALTTFGVGIICLVISNSIAIENQFITFVISMGICGVIPNILFFVLFRKRKEFQIVLGYAKAIGRRLLRRKET